MTRAARYLVFFVVGDVLTAAIVSAVGATFALAYHAVMSLWWAFFELSDALAIGRLEWAWIIFQDSLEEAVPDLARIFTASLILPGLIGAFWLARASSHPQGWRSLFERHWPRDRRS
ncbi:MAG: hypothetical protein HY246_08790 [Proteobacteria bacterium]|nr:hypothetical protein [Pseudomonadota bacterium]